MNELNKINSDIAELQKKRVDLLNEQRGLDEEKILSLDWTKDHEAFFKVDPLCCAGIPYYTIAVVNGPYVLNPIKIMGNDSCYENNIMYGRSFANEHNYFYTDNPDMLFEFLRNVKFKKLHYDQKTLDILNAVAEIAQNMEQ
jgi:hypothetical protein